MTLRTKLYFILLIAIIINLSSQLFEELWLPTVKAHWAKGSYIASIEVDYPTKSSVVRGLREFNELGLGFFDLVPSEGTRPIYIKQTDMTENIWKVFGVGKYDFVAIAIPTPSSCSIYINKHYETFPLEDIIIHEYLHCLGFEHVDNPTDLMYPDAGITTSFASKAGYAVQVMRILHGRL